MLYLKIHFIGKNKKNIADTVTRLGSERIGLDG